MNLEDRPFLMRRFALFLILVLTLLVAARMAAGQTPPAPSFELVRQIGQAAPQNVQYDPNFDQLAYTDAQSRLVLVSAADLSERFVLYPNGAYNAYAFSHDGHWLAVALGQKVEVWDTQTGKKSLDMEQAVIRLDGPLIFSDDDTLLLFNAVVPAPADIRLSETDTSNVPWLWDLAAQRRERTSILLGNVLAEPFYDLRNGFVLGPNNRIAVAKPGLIEIHTIAPDGFPSVRDIETQRYERDPMDLWFSLSGRSIYFRPNDQSSLIQIDPQHDTALTIPTGRQLGAGELKPFQSLVMGKDARMIGAANSLRSNSFLTLLLGENYIQAFGNHPLTVMLLDVLKPITVGKDQMGMLVYVFDEQDGRGVLDFIRPSDIVDMAVHPNGHHIAVRRASGKQAVEIYDLHSGNLDRSLVPALPDSDGTQLLAYNHEGTALNVGWQRFDGQTGALLHEDLSYRPAFDQVYFSDDSQSLLTISGSEVSTWDLSTGQVVRTETSHPQGALFQTASNGRQTLYTLLNDDNTTHGMQLLDMGSGDRRTVIFTPPPGRTVEQVFPSPDWEHYLVAFSATEFSPYYPGNEVALYSLNDGQQWFFAGDDLPPSDSRSYGWIDNRTAYIANGSVGQNQPGRVYGIDYDPSGMPACLVKSFPDDWTRWTDIWERLNATVSAEILGRLAQRLCATVPQGEESVDGLFHPTATPTRPRVTATPSFVAGLPACLSSRYPNQAQQYAQEWRKLTEGLTSEQVNQLQDVLCAGLRQGLNVPPAIPTPGLQDAGPQMSVMTIDVATGKRAFGSVIPPSAPYEDALSLVYDEFTRTMGYQPNNATLSPDRTLLAVQTPDGHIAIYKLLRPYTTLVATQQAMVQATITAQPKLLALAPTATEPFHAAGQARPTLTPTVTPTSPPPATQAAPLPDNGKVQEMCADTMLHTVKDLPTGYAASGRLLAGRDTSSVVWVYDPATGIGKPDETRVDASAAGQLSFNQDWLLQQNGDVVVSRADGSDPVVLFTAAEAASLLQGISWLNPNTVEYVYSGYAPMVSSQAITLVRDYNAATKTLSDPFTLPPPIEVNGLPVAGSLEQPDHGALALVATQFNAGLNTGYKYSIFDRADGSVSYFARSNDGSNLQTEWHPLGKALYYRLPTAPTWYVFDPVTRQHGVLGDFPQGQWSRDGRYRARWFSLSDSELHQRVRHSQPIPKISLWDSDTGLIRQYCVPETDTQSFDGTIFYWSPDNRYLAFQLMLPAEANQEAARARTLILDTQTGSVTDLTFDIGRIIVWTE